MTPGQQFFGFITAIMLLAIVLVSTFFVVRYCKKHSQDSILSRALNSIGLFILLFLLFGALLLPVWGYLGFATYDRRVEADLALSQTPLCITAASDISVTTRIP